MKKLWIIAVLALAGCGEPFVEDEADDDDVEVLILETGVVEYPEQDVCVPLPVEHRMTPEPGRR